MYRQRPTRSRLNPEITLQQGIKHRLAIIEEFNGRLAHGTPLLDFGCGAGDDVIAWRALGLGAMGCDVGYYSNDQDCLAMYEKGVLRLISKEPYRIPFDDDSFDIVVSNQVFEHVKDYPTAIREIHRVLKPRGVALHLFPPRWKPIEAHVFVPFAGAWRGRMWLRIWAQLGIRNEFQRGLSSVQVTTSNYQYLRDNTNYLSTREIQSHFGRFFSEVHFAEDIYIKHSPSSRAKCLSRAFRYLPILRRAYSVFKERVIITVK